MSTSVVPSNGYPSPRQASNEAGLVKSDGCFTEWPGPPELRALVNDLLGEGKFVVEFLDCSCLAGSSVLRMRFEVNGLIRSLVVKRQDPDIALRNWLVARRWLPAASLSENGPPLAGVAAERDGAHVWHVFTDLGDRTLDEARPERESVRAAVESFSQVHIRFRDHPLLAECRLRGGDRGASFYAVSVRDAIRGLEALRPPAVELPSEGVALRDRLLQGLYRLHKEEFWRLEMLRQLGGPETLLHGDLWPKNLLLVPTGNGLQAKLVDWDRLGVGPVVYDLSTFLSRFPVRDRCWIMDLYREALDSVGWHLPSARELNLLFETVELTRLANCVIWPALALWRDRADWALAKLAAIENWFEALRPVLPIERFGSAYQ